MEPAGPYCTRKARHAAFDCQLNCGPDLGRSTFPILMHGSTGMRSSSLAGRSAFARTVDGYAARFPRFGQAFRRSRCHIEKEHIRDIVTQFADHTRVFLLSPERRDRANGSSVRS
jgi:hypothetical protein